MILIGDSKQLQPVVSEAERRVLTVGQSSIIDAAHNTKASRQDSAGLLGGSLFTWLVERGFPASATVLLNQQNRMHPTLGALVSRVFYDGALESGPAAPMLELRAGPLVRPVIWVDTARLQGAQESRARGTSLFNEGEARLVTDLTRYLVRHLSEAVDIGIITAYADQRALILRLLEPGAAGLRQGGRVEVDTVDAFEGRQKGVILLSLVRSNGHQQIGFLRAWERLNVSVSRACHMLVIVGDSSTLQGGAFARLRGAVAELGTILPASVLCAAFESEVFVQPSMSKD
jgi:superfamily I DNA and/or RNA helicase